MCDGLNHRALQVTWAQQDRGSVFNTHPNLPKKGYFCWFQAAGPGARDAAAHSDGPGAEGRLHPWSISWVISAVPPSHHTSPWLFLPLGAEGSIWGLAGSRWTCQGSSGRWAERADELLSVPSCWAGPRGNCWSWDPAPRWDLEPAPRRKTLISLKHHSLKTWKGKAFEIRENSRKYLQNVFNISSDFREPKAILSSCPHLWFCSGSAFLGCKNYFSEVFSLLLVFPSPERSWLLLAALCCLIYKLKGSFSKPGLLLVLNCCNKLKTWCFRSSSLGGNGLMDGSRR